MKPATLQVNIQGMSCASCASKITSALQRHSNVESAIIDFATGSGKIEGDISIKEVSEIVKNLGYKATDRSEMNSSGAAQPLLSQVIHEWVKLIPAGFLLIWVLFFSMGPWNFDNSPYFQFIGCTAFLLWPGRIFFVRTFHQLRNKFITMDALVAMGMLCAWIVSVRLLLMGEFHHLFFESAVTIGFFVIFGKTLEAFARIKAIQDVDHLVKLRPRTAWKYQPSGTLEEAKIETFKIDDILYLRPGDLLPMDGIILDESGSFDESILTGESLPVVRTSGTEVRSGALNCGATGIKIKVCKVGSDTSIEQIISLIENARLARPSIQAFADRLSAIFVPTVIAVASVTILYWHFLYQFSFQDAVMRGLTVLVVACPCALGLATPVAWVAGLGRAARDGILINSFDALEALASAQLIVFDKTGTLTIGKPMVTKVVREGILKDDALMPIIYSALSHSSHPMSRTISSWIKSQFDVSSAPISKLLEEVAGKGIHVSIFSNPKMDVKIGQTNFAIKSQVLSWADSIQSNHSLVAVSIDGHPHCLFELEDLIRPDAKQSIRELAALDLEIYIASGDKKNAVETLYKQLPGITGFRAELTPIEKQMFVKSFQDKGKKVAFLGDGINDAPALALANVGIALGTGADIAAHSAGLVFQKVNISTILRAIQLSKKIRAVIYQNFFWALCYNIAAIPLAFFGRMTPMWASLAMTLSSLSVVLNAMRLRR